MSGLQVSIQTGMKGLRASSLETCTRLDRGWEFCLCDADQATTPEELRGLAVEWHPAALPCTVASALRALGQLERHLKFDLDARDYWFRFRGDVPAEATDAAFLVFEGLATLAEIFVNGRKVLDTDNMFRQYVCACQDADPKGASPQGPGEIHLRFRSLAVALEARRPRARWRTRLASHRNLRFFRTSLLGHMPGICPPVPPIGPWRPILLVDRGPVRVASLEVRPSLDGATGHVDVVLDLVAAAERDLRLAKLGVVVGRHASPLRAEPTTNGGFRFTGTVRIADAGLWWPHTHGTPHLYPARIEGTIGGRETLLELAPIGFRTVELRDFGADAEIVVNGVPIFCRGACWTPVDLISLSARDGELRAALAAARDAGMNMLRISGNMAYETNEFFDLCDSLGILVWQDFMFASMDYPTDDPRFAGNIEAEVIATLDRIAHRPSLAVLCPGSELLQQPAMLGLPPEQWSNPWFASRLPELCRERRPDVPFCEGSPSGGVMPFYCDQGVGHYFGVGGYRRGLEDAWISEPRFANECLAFAIPPTSPGAEGAVPRDNGAEWDFMDVTDHYLREVFGCAATDLDEPARHALRAAAVGEVMSRVQSVWRRPGARCRGALVWWLRDLGPGPGFGIVDASGSPKAPYYYLKRVWAPLALTFLDRGIDGLRVVVANDSAQAVSATLTLALSRLDGTVVARGAVAVRCPSRASCEVAVETAIGAFVDSSYAYRFGPPGFDVVHAVLALDSAAEAARDIEAVHLRPDIGLLPRQGLGLEATVLPRDDESSLLRVSAAAFAQTVTIATGGLDVSDNFFHLPADRARTVIVDASAAEVARRVSVSALNSDVSVAVRGAPGR